MFTIISRIINFGFKNFRRNGWLSTATVAIMTLALMVFVTLIVFGYITNAAASSIQSKIDISAYFNTNTPEDTILNIQSSLEDMPQVASVQYTSRDDALAAFKATHANDPTISQAISELDTNPLEASLDIKAKNPNDYSQIAAYLNSPDVSQNIDQLSYNNDQSLIDKLARIIRVIDTGGFAMIVILAIVAGLVVFNTIRLAIYSNREEIGIMRVVGASNALVRGPFVVEGIIAAVISAVISIILIAPAVYFISPYMNILIPDLGLFQYFYTHLLLLLLYVVIFGVIIGTFSSFFAVRRYLRN